MFSFRWCWFFLFFQKIVIILSRIVFNFCTVCTIIDLICISVNNQIHLCKYRIYIYTENSVLVYIIALSILYSVLKLVQKTKYIIKHTNIIYMIFSKIL